MNKQDEYTYPGRGIHDPKFLASLTNGKLSKMLTAIREANEKEKEGEKKLDVQIRNNYLNIYYRGSNAARIKSENSVEFDEFYFYNEAEGYNLTGQPKKEIMEDKEIVRKLKDKRDELKRLFKKEDYAGYFSGVKTAIDDWLKNNPKPEREIQHKMVVCNTLAGHTIIDIEFQVSELSKYRCKYKKKDAENHAKPRFDIIAVNAVGEICVIELKKGIGALQGTSGLKEHWDCFEKSVGDAGRNKPFVKEIEKLLAQKQEFGLIKKDVSTKSDNVKFIFAYEYDNRDTEKYQEAKFVKEFEEIPQQERSMIKTLWLKKGVICRQTP